MATCSSILAWRIPWRGTRGATVHGVAKRRTQLTNTFNTFRGARTALGEEGLKPKDRKRQMKMNPCVTFFESHKQRSGYLLIVCFLESAATWDDGINLDTFFFRF